MGLEREGWKGRNALTLEGGSGSDLSVEGGKRLVV